MIPIQRILCPVDFSECSERSFRYAVALARWYSADIELLHVESANPFPPAGWIAAAGADEVGSITRAQSAEKMRKLLGSVPTSGVRTESVFLRGDPAAQIIDRLNHLPADLLVLGTHGRSGFERWALGSVAEKVLRRAGCPVLTVPPKMGQARGDKQEAFQRILCPVDFSEASLLALEYAFSLARESDGQIALFHCTQALSEEDSPELLHFDISRFRQHLEETARQKLSTLIPSGAREWCNPEILVSSGKAYREILRVSEEKESDVIVMGIHGHRPFDLSLYGSTAQQIVRRAACPVLTLGARRRSAARLPVHPIAAP